jgi:hypothetical protein
MAKRVMEKMENEPETSGDVFSGEEFSLTSERLWDLHHDYGMGCAPCRGLKAIISCSPALTRR